MISFFFFSMHKTIMIVEHLSSRRSYVHKKKMHLRNSMLYRDKKKSQKLYFNKSCILFQKRKKNLNICAQFVVGFQFNTMNLLLQLSACFLYFSRPDYDNRYLWLCIRTFAWLYFHLASL